MVAGSNYLGAGYEVRLPLLFPGDLDPLKVTWSYVLYIFTAIVRMFTFKNQFLLLLLLFFIVFYCNRRKEITHVLVMKAKHLVYYSIIEFIH